MKRFPRRTLIFHAPIATFTWLFRTCPYALFVHFFSGVLIQQHIRRKTTSSNGGFTSGLCQSPIHVHAVSQAPRRAIEACLAPHPACVDVSPTHTLRTHI